MNVKAALDEHDFCMKLDASNVSEREQVIVKELRRLQTQVSSLQDDVTRLGWEVQPTTNWGA